MPRKKEFKTTLRDIFIPFADALATAFEVRIAELLSGDPHRSRERQQARRLATPKTVVVLRKSSRSEAQELRERIPAFLRRQKGGAAIAQIASSVSATPEAARYALKLLREEKKVRMSGSRATAKWHVR